MKKVVDIRVTDKTKINFPTTQISRIKKNPRETGASALTVHRSVRLVTLPATSACTYNLKELLNANNLNFTYDLARIAQTENYCVLLVDV